MRLHDAASLVPREDHQHSGEPRVRACAPELSSRRVSISNTLGVVITMNSLSHATAVSGRLFFLDLGAGRILSANPDGSGLKVVVEEGRKLPDGLAIDAVAGHLYWTNMGNLKANDGSIMRSNLDGTHLKTLVP